MVRQNCDSNCKQQSHYHISKLFAPVACLLNWFELVYGSFGATCTRNLISVYLDQPGRNIPMLGSKHCIFWEGHKILAERTHASSVFGRLAIPITNGRGVEYAHHITTGPSRFEDLLTSLILALVHAFLLCVDRNQFSGACCYLHFWKMQERFWKAGKVLEMQEMF